MPPTCVQSTIDVKADKSYERKVAKNIAISVGVGMLILLVIILLLKFYGLSTFFGGNQLEKNIGLFNFADRMWYPALMIIFFLISAACFIGYGGRLGKGPTKEKDTVVSSLLAAAIICLLISAIMLWFKVYVYTNA
jgi:hypothetical protein